MYMYVVWVNDASIAGDTLTLKGDRHWVRDSQEAKNAHWNSVIFWMPRIEGET